jgi:capsular exopolysaccharide synthesis family protein
MTLENYWNIMVRQWKIVVICFLLTGLGTFLISKLMTPIYQSSALIQIWISSGNSQVDYNTLLASDQLVQTEAQLATSDAVLRDVASRYRGLTPDQLSKEATTTPQLNTQLFKITVKDANPLRAAALANDIATTFIKQQQQTIQENNKQTQQQLQTDLDTTRMQINAVTEELAAIAGQNGQSAQRAILQAELDGLQQHYSQCRATLAQLELAQAQSGNFLSIVQHAQPSPQPVEPNVLLNTVAGFLAGLFLGMVLAVLYVQLDTRVRNAEELSSLFSWSVLSTIWATRVSQGEMVINPKGRDANIEAYRRLRSSIGFASIDKPMHTFLVTSGIPKEGKSVVAANLAIFMAKAGKTTLLIDADLRHPTLHKEFSLLAGKQGLSDAVLAFSSPVIRRASSQQVHDNANLIWTAFVHSVDIPNLLVMPAGTLPPNPTELLESKAMQSFITALTQSNMEIIIFDTSPLLGLSDASILASKVDGTLMVVDISRANKERVKRSQALLKQAGANVLGFVVNKQKRQRKDTYAYYTDSYSEEQSLSGSQSEFVSEGDTIKLPKISLVAAKTMGE